MSKVNLQLIDINIFDKSTWKAFKFYENTIEDIWVEFKDIPTNAIKTHRTMELKEG